MFGAERRDFPARRVDNDTGHICRLPGRCSTFNVDAVRQTGNQIAAFRIDGQVQRLQKNRDRLRGGLRNTAVFNDHRDDAFTARYGGGQPETGAGIAGAIDRGRTFPGLFAVAPRTDRHFGSYRNTAFGPLDMQIGGDHVTGAITIAYKNNLALESRSAVSTDVELALSPAIGPGMRDANRVFASGLSWWNVPGKPGDAVDNRRDTRGDGVAFGSFDLKQYCFAQSSRNRGMAIRAQKNASNVKGFAAPVDRFIGRNVDEVALDAACLGSIWIRRRESHVFAAQYEAVSNEVAPEGHGGNALKQMIGFKEARRFHSGLQSTFTNDNCLQRPFLRPFSLKSLGAGRKWCL